MTPRLHSSRRVNWLQYVSIALTCVVGAVTLVCLHGDLATRIVSQKNDVELTTQLRLQHMSSRIYVRKRKDQDECRGVASQVLGIDGYQDMFVSPCSFSLPADIVLGAIGGYFSAQTDSALVIGAGTGITPATAAEQYRDVTLVDINPNTPELLRYFRDINDDLLNASNVRLVLQDANSWLATTTKNFDLILVQTTSPASRGTNSVFTQEFMRMARSKLSPGGVLVYWAGSADQVAGAQTIEQTLASVFDYRGLFPAERQYHFWVASKTPLTFMARDFLYTSTQKQLLEGYLRKRQQRLEESAPCLASRDMPAFKKGAQSITLGGFIGRYWTPASLPVGSNGHINTMNTPYLRYEATVTWSSRSLARQKRGKQSYSEWMTQYYLTNLKASRDGNGVCH